MAEKITDKMVRSLSAPSTGQRIVYDTEIKGLDV